MADNVSITAGAGTTIAADDVGGVLHQRVKLSLGADGVANDANVGAGAVSTGTLRTTLASDDPAVTSLTTISSRLPTTLAGTVQATITRPANTTAYTANDVVGGAITFATGLTSSQHAIILGADLQLQISAIPSGMTSFRLYLYDVTPASAIADNAAFDFASTDRTSFLGYVDLGSPADLGSTCFCQVDGVNKKIKLNGSANLFGYLVTNGGFTPAANSEVYLLRLNLIGS